MTDKTDWLGFISIVILGLFIVSGLSGCALFRTPKTVTIYECNSCIEHSVYCSFNGDKYEMQPCWTHVDGEFDKLKFCPKHEEHGKLYHGVEGGK